MRFLAPVLLAWLTAGSFASILLPRDENGTLDLRAVTALYDAEQLVKNAIAQAAKLNKARLDSPVRNRYTLAPRTKLESRSGSDLDQTPVPPLLDVTDELAAAAALVAEAQAASGLLGNISIPTDVLTKRGTFWMESIARKGTSPWGDDANYKVFRNVKDYGAKGDGKTDDTAAINKAISDGKRCGKNCNGSSTKNAIVYLPPGTYLVSSPLIIMFGTQFIGDANSWPVIKAAGSFVGLGVLTTDVYVGDGAGADGKDNEWYVNTASFYRQIRNMRIDVTSTDANAYVCGIHYQVAQATSLQFVEIIAKTGTTQQGMFTENGSGGVIADVTFTGGSFGIYGGDQQFTVQRLKFNGCSTAVQTIWDWGWVWKTVTVTNADVGFRLVPQGDSGNIGSATFMDTIFTNVKQAIVVAPPSKDTGTGTTGIVLDNVAFKSVSVGVADTSGKTILSGSTSISNWVLGPVYNGTQRTWSAGSSHDQLRDLTLLGPQVTGMANVPYYERAKAQYEGKSPSDFVHLKDLGAKGDGKSDDTAAVQAAFSKNVGKIIFADAGVYLLSDTVTIPPGTVIVGEAWTQFAATGSKFGDPSNPRPMLQVGKAGDKGSVEMQDLIFTSKGPTPGVVLIEWNILADKQGSAAMWDCHVRLGGATGTQLTPKECPALTNGQVNTGCMTASLVLHVTAGASGYFDNMWLWTADHMIDDSDLNSGKNDLTQLSVFTARGMLIESSAATWLYGTASEHASMYQYNFQGAKHVFAGLLQTETPYYQPKPTAPNPYSKNVGVFADPDYSCPASELNGCDSAWGLVITKSQDIYIASAGIYSFFDTYTQDCIDTHTCQHALVLLQKNFAQVRIQQLITIGAKYSVVSENAGILATDNLAIKSHPAWSQISLIDATSRGYAPPDLDIPDLIPCDGNKQYASLDALLADVANVPSNCVAFYALPLLYGLLQTAANNYTSLTKNGNYDDKYNAYVRYVKDQTPMQLYKFMDPNGGPGNKYFDCDVTDAGSGKNGHSSPCNPNLIVDNTHNPVFTITYTLRDHDGFFADLLKTYGITEDWVKFGDHTDQQSCGSRGCPSSVYRRTYNNGPLAADSYTVPDPKDIIEGGLLGFARVSDTVVGYILQQRFNQFIGVPADTIQVLEIPISMFAQATEAMATVADIGEKEEEAEKKQLIITIVSAILFALPLVGEGLGAAAGTIVASVGRIIALVGAAGNAALSIYQIYEDPASAPFEILGILTGGTGGLGRTVGELSALGKLRKAIGDVNLARLGSVFQREDAIITKLVNFCRK